MDLFIEKIKSITTLDDAKELLLDQTKQCENCKHVKEAVEFATLWHEGQFRKSSQPYIIHPILVASLVSYFGGDEEMIIAALLHDVLEDTACTDREIEEKFSTNITKLVEGLTKIIEIREAKLIPSSSDERLITSALSFRKMLLASISDVRVLVVKLCDRLHNMLTLDALSPAKQKRISEETLVVYAPIAHRLGISKIKNILEDLSFYYIMPDEYNKIDSLLYAKDQELQLALNSYIDKVTKLLLQNGFVDKSFEIQRRIKHYYSIYMKMHRKGICIDEVLDLMAIRVLVKEPLDCYKALGIIHQNFTPLISRFKDYVAVPKDNGYQTIHTTIFNNTSIIETQIRTFDMHKTAEYGIAAHWKYKGLSTLSPKLEWLNELKNQSDESENIEEMYSLAKDDLYSEDISVFSPKGDIYTLPRGATALDFAYAVHTEVGNHAQKSLVNKLRVPLLTELKNGDIVSIERSEELVLRCSWIESVKTAKAKNAMKSNCKQKLKELNTLIGENILLNSFNLKYQQLEPYLDELNLEQNLHRLATDHEYLQEILLQLKSIIIKNAKILPIISPIRKYKLKLQKFDNLIFHTTSGISKVMFEYCCHPKRGDDIVAFKDGSNAVIHHKFCSNAHKNLKKRVPTYFVEWEKTKPDIYKLIVSIENKRGSLAEFLQFLAKIDVNLVTIELSQHENSEAIFFKMEVEVPKKSIDKLISTKNSKYRVIEFVPIDDAYKKI